MSNEQRKNMTSRGERRGADEVFSSIF